MSSGGGGSFCIHSPVHRYNDIRGHPGHSRKRCVTVTVAVAVAVAVGDMVAGETEVMPCLESFFYYGIDGDY